MKFKFNKLFIGIALWFEKLQNNYILKKIIKNVYILQQKIKYINSQYKFLLFCCIKRSEFLYK